MDSKRSFSDILSGSIFVGFGLAFAATSLSYEIGTALRMGPGYFPLVVGGILVGLGLLILGKGLVAGEQLPFGIVPWRAVVLVVAALIFFGATVRGLGLVPATGAAVLLTAFASYRMRVRTALIVTVGLTALCLLVFVVALQLRLPAFGPWLAG